MIKFVLFQYPDPRSSTKSWLRPKQGLTIILLLKKHRPSKSMKKLSDLGIEKGINIEYPYNFELPLGNSDFVTIWLEFDLLVRTIVQSRWNER